MSERSQIAAGIIANEIDAAKELLSGGSIEREINWRRLYVLSKRSVRCGLADRRRGCKIGGWSWWRSRGSGATGE